MENPVALILGSLPYLESDMGYKIRLHLKIMVYNLKVTLIIEYAKDRGREKLPYLPARSW